jgi:hypothetical protein
VAVKFEVGDLLVTKGWYDLEYAVILKINYSWYTLRTLSNGSITKVNYAGLNKLYILHNFSRRTDV